MNGKAMGWDHGGIEMLCDCGVVVAFTRLVDGGIEVF